MPDERLISMTRKLVLSLFVVLACGVISPVRSARAHEGPPFPILVDHEIPGYMVTIWADPDIGEAIFYVVLEPGKSPSAGAPTGVDVWIQPVSERLPKVVYHAERESGGGPLRYAARPFLDAQEMWTVGVDIRLAEGDTHQLTAEVEATPPGPTPWDLLIYLFPFVLFGGLWGFAFVRRAGRARMRPNPPRPQPPMISTSEADDLAPSRPGTRHPS